MIEKQTSEQIINFLEKHRGEIFSKTELVSIFDISVRSITKSLMNLIKHNEIEFEKISVRVARKIYKDDNLKRGMKIYFLE